MPTSTPPDVFGGFLALLEAGLSQPAGSADDVAGRLAISRSQLDRLVAAAAGEPPARFRRRILLERAAYRLLTGTESVLDVGVEAGYASNEAFTRAFTRAFGAPPSKWRRRPHSLRIDAPSGVHFYPPCGLRLPTQAKATSMDLLVTMTEHHIWVIETLADRAGRLDADQLDRPIEISLDTIDRAPTIRSLLSRLVGQLDMWNHAIADRPYDFGVERDEGIASMRRRLGDCGPIFLAQVRDACANGTLEDAFVTATETSPEFFTYGGMLAHVLAYGAYRRTMATAAVNAAGITDFEDDPLAWEPVRPPGPTAP